MKLNFFFFLLAFVISIAVSSCKTCNECRVQRTTNVNDSTIVSILNPYPEICGSKKDLRAYEDRCKAEFKSEEGDLIQDLCICTEVD